MRLFSAQRKREALGRGSVKQIQVNQQCEGVSHKSLYPIFTSSFFIILLLGRSGCDFKIQVFDFVHFITTSLKSPYVAQCPYKKK